GEDGTRLKVLWVNDLVELQPFEGASNRTATVVLEKGEPTEYPLGYVLWRKAKPGRIGVDLSLKEVEERSRKIPLSARPVNPSEPSSPWLTVSPAALAALQKVVGPSAYRAYAGSYTGGLNGVYWLRVLERQPDGLLLVENLHDVGKTKVKRVEALLEPHLVYPLLRGRDIFRWKGRPSAHILVVQDPVKRTGYEESWLKVNYPHTYGYLKQFEVALRSERRSQAVRDLMEKGAFYSMYAVAEYTFAPYKVVWREQATALTAAVAAGEEKPEVPDHKLMLVPCSTEDEAFYLAAALNSAAPRLVVASYVVAIGISTHVLEHVDIPKFDPSNALHESLASLSRRAHQLAARGKGGDAQLRQVEEEIDQQAAELWGITEGELEEIRRALAELG
ncbi:MAG TPA: SAM-dependent DNA methyltransferase, partial [Dehalococcoidia bacterium]|nr:SAM-dependent DNA methyltransferase [Dehalococcoidia bacterium]